VLFYFSFAEFLYDFSVFFTENGGIPFFEGFQSGMLFVSSAGMFNPIRFLLAGFLALSISPVLAVPVLTYTSVWAYAKDSGITYQDSPLAIGGSAVASGSLGTVSTEITATAMPSSNSLTLEGTLMERLGAPHLPFEAHYDPEKMYYYYGDTSMSALSQFTGIVTLDAADSGYTYAMTASFDQAGTSQMALLASLWDLADYSARYDLNQYNPISTDGSMGLGTGAQVLYHAGSATGDLVAGHSYSFVFLHKIQHNGVAARGTATDAQGTFALSIQGPAPAAVPEPSGLILCGLGLGGMVWVARKRSASRS
jgi:hypothetical protein